MLDVLATVLVFAFPALVVVAALKDVTSYTIPNWISAALVAAYLPAAFAAGVPLEVIGQSAAVGAGALVAGMAMFALGWIGGGDAKLFAACALWLGLPSMLAFLAGTALAGGALALFLLQLRAPIYKPLLARGPAWFGRLAASGADAPYGVAIAVGALFVFPGSPLAAALGFS